MADQEPLLHLLHLGSNPLIRTIRMRPPSLKCHACGPNRTITVDTYDYDEFCAGAGPAETSEGDGFVNGRAGERISAKVSHAACPSPPVMGLYTDVFRNSQVS